MKYPCTINITIPLKPKALMRHRSTRSGHCYDPQQNKDFKEMVDLYTLRQVPTSIRPIKGALHTKMLFYVPIPQSWSKKKQRQAESGEIEPTTRPDLDNYLKMINDAFNNGIIEDDSHITSSYERKIYSKNPRIEIEITYDKAKQ